MWKLIIASLLVFLSQGVRAGTCALPAADSGEPYVTLADLPKDELRLLLNEYMSLHQWTKHSEALSAGFQTGHRVYSEVLKSGGRFSSQKTAVWRLAYEKAGRRQFRAKVEAKVDMATVDRAVVGWLLQVCLGSNLWSEVRAINDCRFKFTAGRMLDDASRETVQPLRFEVRGGRCGQWLGQPLSVKGDTVQCVRSGAGAVTIELTTDHAGTTRQTLSALTTVDMPPEPVQQIRPSQPVSEVISLWRSRDYRLRQLGRGCPTCELYAADIRPSDPNATILRATTISSSGGGWRRYPRQVFGVESTSSHLSTIRNSAAARACLHVASGDWPRMTWRPLTSSSSPIRRQRLRASTVLAA